MKRPLAIVALFYVGGLVAGSIAPLPLPLLFGLAFALLALTIFLPKRKEFFLSGTLIAVGWANLLTHTAIVSPHDLRRHIGDETMDIRVRGKLLETPSERRYETDGKEAWRTLARVELHSVHTNANWEPSHGQIMVSTAGQLGNNFFGGQEVEINGLIHRPRMPMAEGLFDYRAFLEHQGVFYQLDVPSPAEWQSHSGSENQPLARRFFLWSQQALQHGLDNNDGSLRLLWAMTLGWKTALTDEVSEPFMQSGTMHIFAISGLHIALISGILVSLLRVFRVPRALCGGIVIPLIWFYTAATGWQPSAIRSTVMMTVVLVGWSLKRPGNLLNSLGAAAFIILLWDPRQLFQASFQLSFFVVLSIALLMPKFEQIRQRLVRHDPFLPNELRPRWQRWLDVPIRWTTTLLATSLAAWLGSLPLTAYYFHLVTPISLLANMVVVPLSSLALMANLGSLICAGWFPFLTEIFNASGWLFMTMMVDASEWFARVPGAFFNISSPSKVTFILYYGTVFSFLLGWWFEKSKRGFTFGAIGLLSAIWLWHHNAGRNAWELTILPLAGGEAIHVNAPGQKNDLLIDCGNQRSLDFITRPFLQAKGINRLPKLLLTHGDLKNIGGATTVIAAFQVEQAFLSPVKFRSPAYRAIQGELRKTPSLLRELKRGDQVGIWTVLHPEEKDKFPQADDGPLVLYGEIYGKRILLLSDLSRDGQHLFWERNPHFKADIVVAGMPRESEPLNDAMLASLQAELIIITDTEFPATERASAKLRQRLAKQKSRVLYCRETGAVTLEFQPDHFKARTAWPVRLIETEPR